MSAWKRVMLVLFSAGWVVPLWFAMGDVAGTTMDVLRFWAYGGKGWPSAATGTSFPIEEFSFQVDAVLIGVAMLWLIGVIVFWVLRATRTPRNDSSREA